MSRPDLVVLGNLALDDIVYPDGQTRMAQPGGAALYVTLTARLWGLEVELVTICGTDYPEWVLHALEDRGVGVGGVHRLDRPGLRSWLLYEGTRRRVVHRLAGPTHAEMSPTARQIPEAARRARVFYLAPMPLSSQAGLVDLLEELPGTLLALDPYARVREEELRSWRRLLAGVDIFFLSEDEMELPGEDPRATLTPLATDRLGWVVYKRGAQGGLLWDAARGTARTWEPREAGVVDPTGAGDAFAAGFLAGWLREEGPEGALRRGVVSASFALEAPGPVGLLTASPEEAMARYESWYGP